MRIENLERILNPKMRLHKKIRRLGFQMLCVEKKKGKINEGERGKNKTKESEKFYRDKIGNGKTHSSKG
jgi:hypothetical protein